MEKMERQLTAIDWLMNESMKLVVQYMQGTLNTDNLDDVIYEIGTKAKEMEKEQIIEAYKADCETLGNDGTFNNEAEQYYNETFKSE